MNLPMAMRVSVCPPISAVTYVPFKWPTTVQQHNTICLKIGKFRVIVESKAKKKQEKSGYHIDCSILKHWRERPTTAYVKWYVYLTFGKICVLYAIYVWNSLFFFSLKVCNHSFFLHAYHKYNFIFFVEK